MDDGPNMGTEGVALKTQGENDTLSAFPSMNNLTVNFEYFTVG